MKKTQMKNLRRSIIKNGVSFFAVSFIAAVSIALFSGIRSAGMAITNSASRHYEEQKVADVEITCANGITEDDITEILSHKDILDAEGGYTAIVTTKRENETLVLQALSIGDNVNIPVVVDGTLPQTDSEVAVEEQYALKKELKIGDTLTINQNDAFVNNQFKITAIVNDPRYSYYITKDTRGLSEIGTGDASFYICLNKDAFHTEYFDECYPVVDIRADFAATQTDNTEEYEKSVKELTSELEQLGKERAQLRFDRLYQEAHDELFAVIPDETLVQEEIDKLNIQKKDWVIIERDAMGDLLAVEIVVNSIKGLSLSFALIFLLVAVIVCYTAVARMISDQRSLIGAQKALGFTSGEILRHYMLYNILSSVLGIILGCLMGIYIVEVVILYIYSVEMLFDIFHLTFDFIAGGIVVITCLLIFIVATLAASVRLIKQPAIDLMRGEVPVSGKRLFFEKWTIYKKCSLYSRTMIKNLLTDKGRIATTVAGVIGCISLLVICFAIKTSILNATEKQYNELFLYDSRLITDSSAEKTEEFARILSENHFDYTLMQDKLKSFRTPEGSLNSLRIITAENQEKIKEYMVFRNVSDKKIISLPVDGVLISDKMSRVYELYPNDYIEVLDNDGYPRQFRISGVIEHYLSFHMVVTSDAYYEEVMGEKADSCIFVIKQNASELLDQLKQTDGFLYLSDNSEYFNNANGLDLVIYICLVLSAVMALLVLLNQYTMHINKKARELAVMRINGYTIKETKRFIYVDNIILTTIGLILGSGFGGVLSYIVIRVLESNTDNFDFWGAILPSCLYGCLVGIVFTFAVNLIALRRIKKLNLTKASEN